MKLAGVAGPVGASTVNPGPGGYDASASAESGGEGGDRGSGVGGKGEVDASSAVMLGIVAQGTSAKRPTLGSVADERSY